MKPRSGDRLLARAASIDSRIDKALGRALLVLKRNRLYEPLGFARLPDYVREMLGIGLRTVYELIRTESRLATLPAIARAWDSGRLHAEKVRLLCRVATPETDVVWAERARYVSVRDLSDLVGRASEGGAALPDPSPDPASDGESSRAGPETSADDLVPSERGSGRNSVAPGQDPPPDLPDDGGEGLERISFRAPVPVAERWRSTLRLCAAASGESLPDWALAENICAEFLSGCPPFEEKQDAVPTSTEVGSGETVTRRGAPAVVGEAGSAREFDEAPCETGPRSCRLPQSMSVLLDTPPPEDAWRLHEHMLSLASLRAGFEAIVSKQLFRLARPRSGGFSSDRSIARHARAVFGFGERRIRYLLSLERRLAGLPRLRDEYRNGRLSWLQCLLLLKVAGCRKNDLAWIDFARQVTVLRLRRAVEDAAMSGRGSGAALPPPINDPTGAASEDEGGTRAGEAQGGQMSAEGHGRIRSTCVAFQAPRDIAALWRFTLGEVRRVEGLVAADWQAVEHLLDSFEATWDDERARKRRREHHVIDRDGWSCTVPGCSSMRNLHVHHVVFRSRGGGDEEENLTTLCASHHLRGIHGSGGSRVLVEGRAPHDLEWTLGARDDGPPVLVFRGERCTFRLRGGLPQREGTPVPSDTKQDERIDTFPSRAALA